MQFYFELPSALAQKRSKDLLLSIVHATISSVDTYYLCRFFVVLVILFLCLLLERRLFRFYHSMMYKVVYKNAF